jgi:hypothetical protein
VWLTTNLPWVLLCWGLAWPLFKAVEFFDDDDTVMGDLVATYFFLLFVIAVGLGFVFLIPFGP